MMTKLILGIPALNTAAPRNYPHISDDSCFEILNIVSLQFDAPWTISFENHCHVLRLALRIKPEIIFSDHLSKGVGIRGKQGFSEPIEHQQELFF